MRQTFKVPLQKWLMTLKVFHDVRFISSPVALFDRLQSISDDELMGAGCGGGGERKECQFQETISVWSRVL